MYSSVSVLVSHLVGNNSRDTTVGAHFIYILLEIQPIWAFGQRLLA